MTAARLTRDGSPDFEAQLHSDIERVADQVEQGLGPNLVGLVLGGGYGRGEGGVIRDDRGLEKPYNDLDFTVIVGERSARIGAVLGEISHRFTREMGVDVDFSRPLTLADLPRLPHWMMWHDLVQGHCMVRGDRELLTKNTPGYLRQPLPLTEGLRLLLNRGTGLVWALRVVQGYDSGHDGDFCRRNLQKMRLALGDALLVLVGKYTAHCGGRDQLVEQLRPEFPDILDDGLIAEYRGALEFKFRPDSVPGEQPDRHALRLGTSKWIRVLLAYESRRCGRAFSSADEYSRWFGLREPALSQGREGIKNLLRNGRRGKLSFRYPREELYGRLTALMGQASNCDSRAWAEESASYLELWKRYN